MVLSFSPLLSSIFYPPSKFYIMFGFILSLKYSIILWDHFTTSASIMVERAQRKFLCIATHRLNIPHSFFTCLNISTLMDPRHTLNRSFLSNLLFTKTDSPIFLSHENFRIPVQTFNYVIIFLSKLLAPLNFLENSPLVHLMQIVNSDSTFSS